MVNDERTQQQKNNSKPEGLLLSPDQIKILSGIVDIPNQEPVPFSEETLMPLPEKTHAQELLEMPISLENRIAHLIPNVSTYGNGHSKKDISGAIGAGEDWVVSTAKRFGIKMMDRTQYPPLTLELLEEEWLWEQQYDALDAKVSSYRIAELIGRTKFWVATRAGELNIFPVYEKGSVGKMSFVYPKNLALMLRHLNLVVPPQQGWYTIRELEVATSQKGDWIKGILEGNEISPQLRQHDIGRRLFPQYPPESLLILIVAAKERPAFAGDWLTAKAISHRLGKSYDWVSNRIHVYSDLSIKLRDTTGKPAMHYPPFVYKALEKEVNELNSYPEAGDWVPVETLTRRIGRSTLWVANRIPYTSIVPETRLDIMKRPREHFPPTSDNELLSLPLDILDANRRLQVERAILHFFESKSPGAKVTHKLINDLRATDSSTPGHSTIYTHFGSLEGLNTRLNTSKKE